MWREYFLLWIFASLLSEVRFPTRLIDKAVSDGFFLGLTKQSKNSLITVVITWKMQHSVSSVICFDISLYLTKSSNT